VFEVWSDLHVIFIVSWLHIICPRLLLPSCLPVRPWTEIRKGIQKTTIGVGMSWLGNPSVDYGCLFLFNTRVSRVSEELDLVFVVGFQLVDLEHVWHPLAILLTRRPDSAIVFMIMLSTTSVLLMTSVLLQGSWWTNSFSQVFVWFSFASFSSQLWRRVLLMQESLQLIFNFLLLSWRSLKSECTVRNRFFYYSLFSYSACSHCLSRAKIRNYLYCVRFVGGYCASHWLPRDGLLPSPGSSDSLSLISSTSS
jgi:hypothetical protein